VRRITTNDHPPEEEEEEEGKRSKSTHPLPRRMQANPRLPSELWAIVLMDSGLDRCMLPFARLVCREWWQLLRGAFFYPPPVPPPAASLQPPYRRTRATVRCHASLVRLLAARRWFRLLGLALSWWLWPPDVCACHERTIIDVDGKPLFDLRGHESALHDSLAHVARAGALAEMLLWCRTQTSVPLSPRWRAIAYDEALVLALKSGHPDDLEALVEDEGAWPREKRYYAYRPPRPMRVHSRGVALVRRCKRLRKLTSACWTSWSRGQGEAYVALSAAIRERSYPAARALASALAASERFVRDHALELADPEALDALLSSPRWSEEILRCDRWRVSSGLHTATLLELRRRGMGGWTDADAGELSRAAVAWGDLPSLREFMDVRGMHFTTERALGKSFVRDCEALLRCVRYCVERHRCPCVREFLEEIRPRLLQRAVDRGHAGLFAYTVRELMAGVVPGSENGLGRILRTVSHRRDAPTFFEMIAGPHARDADRLWGASVSVAHALPRDLSQSALDGAASQGGVELLSWLLEREGCKRTPGLSGEYALAYWEGEVGVVRRLMERPEFCLDPMEVEATQPERAERWIDVAHHLGRLDGEGRANNDMP
jgi:hypothetical protein